MRAKLTELSKEKFVVADFYTDNCGACKLIEPILRKIKDEHDDVHVEFINATEDRDSAIEFGVMGAPTLIIFRDGVELDDRIVGFMPEPQLLKAIKG